MILVGSAPGETYKGEAARKTFARWKLALRLVGAARWGKVLESQGKLVWVVANLEATSAKGVKTSYRTLLVFLSRQWAAKDDEDASDDEFELVLAHFALVR